MADPRLRQLTIKTGVVKRLTKEKTIYEKEVLIERKRYEKFRMDGADSHVLKKQDEVIEECLMMVPDTLKRLQREFECLAKFLADEKDLEETKEYEIASKVLEEAKEVINKT